MKKRTSTIRNFVIALLAAIVYSSQSCVNHDFPQYVCETEPVSFQFDIAPIINTKCAIPDCHNGSLGPDLNWTVFTNFEARAKSGLVKFRVTNRIMPPSFSPAGPLSQEQINLIACWADQGAQNN